LTLLGCAPKTSWIKSERHGKHVPVNSEDNRPSAQTTIKLVPIIITILRIAPTPPGIETSITPESQCLVART
jgi:hypothetical protein